MIGFFKIIGTIILMGIIVGAAFYTGLLFSLTEFIQSINSNVIAYMPVETRVLVSFLVFVIVVGLVGVFTN